MRPNEIQTDVLAVETHSGRVWSLAILPALIVPAISFFLYPTTPARVGLMVVALVGVAALALVLGGFEYRFLRHGVEVRTLGFLLRAIPRQAIVSYSIETWSLPRGYGIRGIGNTRAYVWGSRVVHIKTTSGDIFLGHNDPERIIRDLNQVTGFATISTSAHAPVNIPESPQASSIGSNWSKALIPLMWLFLVSTAFNYWRNWDQLPARMAVHFDANWQPNGYTSREGALYLGLGIMAFLSVLFTVGALIAHAQKPSAFWPMLIFFYAILGVCWYGNNSIINFNLNSRPAHSELVEQPKLQMASMMAPGAEDRELRAEN
ncbi:MAG TPA: DUF1648 domain-containing protein [Candidatus Sulfotelmatobacter sp.]|jgi:hypothetical protein|nr:DUF1648 domain-containing protein [Candidatus Sulfotelmatobacter sp.]